MKIDYSTVANCPPEQVWAVFSDLNSWSQWNPLAKASWVEGEPWQPGSELLLEPAQSPMKVKAKLQNIVLPSIVSWQGSAMGVSFVHRFEFASQPDGATLMKTVLELSGAATFFISSKMKQQGVDIFAQWFNALKAEAEKRSVTGTV
jgi:uncharacterized protein YndB with AHSA1/START domain